MPNGAFRVAKRAFLCRDTGFMMGRNSLFRVANDVVLCGWNAVRTIPETSSHVV